MSLRLTFLVNSLRTGGAEIHTVSLAEALAARGHQCRLVALRAPAELNVGADIPIETLGGSQVWNLGAQRRLAIELATHTPQVVLGVNERPLIYAQLGQLLAGLKLPTVAIYHTTELGDLRKRVNLAIARPFIARSDMLIYVGANQGRYWRARGLTARHATVINNGVDAARFSPAARSLHRSEMRSALGVEQYYVIGMSAALRTEKNHAQAISALARLRAHGLPAKLLLLGDGPERAAIEAAAAADGVQSDVLFLGRRADVVPTLAAFDVGLLTSTSETFSLAALETMAMGIPMIMSDVGGASEIVTHGSDGFLYPSHDTDALVSYLESAGEPTRRSALGATASATVATRFAFELMVDRYEEMLREVAR